MLSSTLHHHHRACRGHSATGHSRRSVRPAAAYRQRGGQTAGSSVFSAPETWHEAQQPGQIRFVEQPAGTNYVHPVSVEQIRQRISLLPREISRQVQVVQLSTMTRKRRLFPCYGMQWGPNVYLYPIESTLVETYVRPPTPQQQVEAKMFGGVWSHHHDEWRLTWTAETIADFYLNNVLIHEIGHILDQRNTRTVDRERYAIWFATEFGFRADRGRRR
jgi:hypothetical protein